MYMYYVHHCSISMDCMVVVWYAYPSCGVCVCVCVTAIVWGRVKCFIGDLYIHMNPFYVCVWGAASIWEYNVTFYVKSTFVVYADVLVGISASVCLCFTVRR